MKKFLLLILSLTVVLSFAACTTENNNNDGEETTTEETTTEETTTEETTEETTDQESALEGSLEDILAKIYENAEVPDTFKDFIENGLQVTEITSDRVGYHLGKEDIEFEEAIASEPIMSTSAYSLCLVRVKEGADIEQIKTDIEENVDPMKWVCVGVDPSNVIVDSIDDVVILIMSNEAAQPLHEAFLALKD